VLREVICPYTLGPVASSYRRFTVLIVFCLCFLLIFIINTCPQYFHCFFFVFDLGFFILTGYDDFSWLVDQPDRRHGWTDALSTVTARCKRIDPDIVIM